VSDEKKIEYGLDFGTAVAVGVWIMLFWFGAYLTVKELLQ
jgi:hypothetical protein